MNRYIVKHTGNAAGIAIFSTNTAILADTETAARNAFRAAHPDREIIEIRPATDSKLDRMILTDDEAMENKRRMDDFYRASEKAAERVKAELLTYDIDEIIAETAYDQTEAEPRQNADGCRIGDILYTMWGYEQTNVDFYQIVALKGKHTIVLREIAGKSGITCGFNGLTRPVRDRFVTEETRTVRTKTAAEPYCKLDMEAFLDKHRLYPVTFGELYNYSVGA